VCVCVFVCVCARACLYVYWWVNCRPSSMELGGKSPLIIFEDADIDAAVEWAMVCGNLAPVPTHCTPHCTVP
jgi:hypothetical protein